MRLILSTLQIRIYIEISNDKKTSDRGLNQCYYHSKKIKRGSIYYKHDKGIWRVSNGWLLVKVLVKKNAENVDRYSFL